MPINLLPQWLPPGRAVKPLSLVPSFGLFQCFDPASFNFTCASISPPRKLVNVSHSALVGTCQPMGQTLRGSVVAYQVYNLPYVVTLFSLASYGHWYFGVFSDIISALFVFVV